MRLFDRFFRKLLFYAVLLLISALAVSSCGGSKKSAKIKRVERHGNFDPNNPAKNDRSKTVRKALKESEKQRKKDFKEAEKLLKKGVNKRHLANQDKETRKRMDALRKQSEKVNKRK